MKYLKKVAGIDYSVSSPAMCICVGEFKFENLKFYYVTQKPNFQKMYLDGKIEGFAGLDKQFIDIDRLSHLSDCFIDCINDNIDDGERVEIGIEDYAFQGSGNMTMLAENMGLLKYKLRQDHHSYFPYSPATIKKMARECFPKDIQRSKDGKLLKMDKQKMYEAFVYDTGVDLLKIYELDTLLTKSGQPTKGNPITDIVDSYFIAKHHYEMINKG